MANGPTLLLRRHDLVQRSGAQPDYVLDRIDGAGRSLALCQRANSTLQKPQPALRFSAWFWRGRA